MNCMWPSRGQPSPLPKYHLVGNLVVFGTPKSPIPGGNGFFQDSFQSMMEQAGKLVTFLRPLYILHFLSQKSWVHSRRNIFPYGGQGKGKYMSLQEVYCSIFKRVRPRKVIFIGAISKSLSPPIFATWRLARATQWPVSEHAAPPLTHAQTSCGWKRLHDSM